VNTAYRDLALGRISSTIAAAQAVATVKHQGLKGQLREIFVRDLLRPLLPLYIGIGTGEIITADNNHSPQQDVVVYDTRLLPPFLADPSVGLFPVESVLYAIEVKSELNTSELKKVHENATVLKSFNYRPGRHDEALNPIHHKLLRLVAAVFAFSTDLTGNNASEAERYKRLHGDEEPPIQQLCIAGKGAWGWRAQEWHEIPSAHQFQEVLIWLTVLRHDVQRISETRGLPHMGYYWWA
jgi:hypothetical protein